MENTSFVLGGGGSGVEKVYVVFNSHYGVAQASRAFNIWDELQKKNNMANSFTVKLFLARLPAHRFKI